MERKIAGFGNNKMAVAFKKRGKSGDVSVLFLLFSLTS